MESGGMKMTDYIKREAVLQIIDYAKQLTSEQIIRESCAYELLSDTGKACYDGIMTAFDMCKRLINEAVITADVQPVDRWISAEDRLPEEDGDCLVWYRCDTAFGKSESWGIAHCSRCDWYTKHLHGDNIVVLYWQSMPKPPKECKK